MSPFIAKDVLQVLQDPCPLEVVPDLLQTLPWFYPGHPAGSGRQVVLAWPQLAFLGLGVTSRDKPATSLH